MKILHRYVLKEHLGPLTFSLTALTSILLLQYIGKNIGQLVGKGLGAGVVVEFFALSVPLTVALTLPMAVLVSTLFAFSRLASENEITALKASGVSLVSVLKAVLWAAAGITAIMIGFNDQVLPRANHRLAILQRDIAQKKPTFGLREQVINEVSPGKLYLRAAHLDEGSNLMRQVTIFDMGDPARKRTIYADSGNMRMTRGMRDLELTLFHGNMQDVPTATPSQLQRLYFHTDFVRVRGVGNQFEKTTTDTYKGNREMTICEMYAAEKKARVDFLQSRADFVRQRSILLRSRTTLSQSAKNANTATPWDVGIGRWYCEARGLLRVKTAHAQGLSQSSVATSTASSTPMRGVLRRSLPGGAIPAPAGIPGVNVVAADLSNQASAVEVLSTRMSDNATTINALSVEIHKKFALAVACFVFVLLGAPIALRFPRGGVGLTIGVSLVVFALYYIALIGGESLGKRGIVPPMISMWLANLLFATVALVLLRKMGDETATSRGGDAREMLDSLRGWVMKQLGLHREEEQA